ncbi:sigma factor-like helix-turn-helix DNA-binding protein [Cloacibacillus porcorum]
MSRYDQMSVKEIAESMNIGTKGVEYHITKSLKVLRHALKDYLPIFQLLFLN